MAETAVRPAEVVQEPRADDDTLAGRFMEWVRYELVWYAGSFTLHLLGLSLLLLIPNTVMVCAGGDVPSFGEVTAEETDNSKQQAFENFEIGDPDEKQLTVAVFDPTIEKPDRETVTEEYNNDDPVFEHRGGGTPAGSKDMVGGAGFSVIAYGPGVRLAGAGGVGTGLGTGTHPGRGGDGFGDGFKGRGHRKAAIGDGRTPDSDRAATGALVWLVRHQLPEGNWSLQHYTARCKDGTCTGQGQVTADAGATAMSLLCFLAIGQTHKSKGPYRATVTNAINWLIKQQEPSGNLAKNCVQPMYSHALATIALCEAYGLSGDPNIGHAAQGAVNYIINAQNQKDGGWRYNPGDPGDTSVVGWQIMALKSAQIAGLGVGGSIFAGTSKWLDSVQSGPYNSLYAYQPGQGHSNTMTSVGLLCRQYLGAKRADPMMTEGTKYLLGNLPDAQMPNIYYWYYASQVLHNMSGYEWDQWNRRMRKILIDTQCRDSGTCANGSWNPQGDLWGARGGRVMQTALSALTLEIYYRILPLFKDEAAAAAKHVMVGGEK
jgi:hypothetical protein